MYAYKTHTKVKVTLRFYVILIVAVVKVKVQPNDRTWKILSLLPLLLTVTVQVDPVGDLTIIQYHNAGNTRTEIG